MKSLTVAQYLQQVDSRLNLLAHFDATGPNPINYVRKNASFARTSLNRAAKALWGKGLPRKRKG
jgi:hypothetical protein